MIDETKILHEIIASQKDMIEKLTVRIAELERQLGLDSSNSGKPPSSDGLKKGKRTTSLRGKGKKKSGGQKGHKGQTRQQQADPDHIIEHKLAECERCNTPFAKDAVTCLVGKRQVIISTDKPPHQVEDT